jgi:hypothetical protein
MGIQRFLYDSSTKLCADTDFKSSRWQYFTNSSLNSIFGHTFIGATDAVASILNFATINGLESLLLFSINLLQRMENSFIIHSDELLTRANRMSIRRRFFDADLIAMTFKRI